MADELTNCNCRWQGEKNVQICTLHEAWRDAVHEWAERAKEAERALSAVRSSEAALQQQVNAFYGGNPRGGLVAASEAKQKEAAPTEDAEFELHAEDGVCVAATSGPRAQAWAEILADAAQNSQDGPVTIYEVTRKEVTAESMRAYGEAVERTQTSEIASGGQAPGKQPLSDLQLWEVNRQIADADADHALPATGVVDHGTTGRSLAVRCTYCCDIGNGCPRCRTAGATEPEPSEAQKVCYETYAAIGTILAELAEKGHPQAEKLLDNLSEARLVHSDVLPFADTPHGVALPDGSHG